MSTIILLIIVLLFLVVMSLLGWFIAKVVSIFRGIRNFFSPHSDTADSSTNHRKRHNNENDGRQIISDDEGEYIDFEEVKE